MKIAKPDLPMTQLPRESAIDERDPKLLNAARMYEKQFLGEMVKAMRKTVTHGGLIEDSMAEQIFREKLDDQYVENWSDRGGVGFADLIYNQISERYGIGAHPVAKKDFSLSNANVQKVLTQPGNKNNLQMKVILGGEPGKTEVQTPWSGRLLAQGPTPDGRQLVRVGHDSGLVSEFKFRGSLLDHAPGSSIERGTAIGLLAPHSELGFEWQVGR